MGTCPSNRANGKEHVKLEVGMTVVICKVVRSGFRAYRFVNVEDQ